MEKGEPREADGVEARKNPRWRSSGEARREGLRTNPPMASGGHSKARAGVRLWARGMGVRVQRCRPLLGKGGGGGTRRPVRHLSVTGSFLTSCESQLLN